MGLFMRFAFAFSQVEHDERADTTMTTYLSEITIAANRWEQNLLEVPAKISTVSQELVRFQNPQTAADLLSLNGDVFVQKSQLGGGSPMIRGFATNRVMIVVDGVRMNNAIFRSGNVQNVISLDANTVEETEIMFGPGAVMYGSDAIGGVMDFHTLEPVYADDGKSVIKANTLVRYASANNENTFHTDFNVGIRKWSSFTSLTRSKYDDLRMGSNGPAAYTRPDYVDRVDGADMIRVNDDPDLQIHTGYDQWNVMQKIGFKPTPLLNGTYSFHFSKTSDNPRYDRLILREDNELANAEWYYGPQKWVMHSMKLDYSHPSWFSDRAKVIFAYQDYEESRHHRGFGSPWRTNRFERVKASSVNVDLDKQLGKSFSLFYGGEIVSNRVSSVGNRINVNDGTVMPVSTRYPDGSSWRSLALYASVRMHASKTLSVNAGARYTSVRTEATFAQTFFNFPFRTANLQNHAVNGSLGVVFNPTEKWKFYGTASTGFRAPNIDDIGKVFDSEPGNVVVPNPSLQPENAYNIEAGFAGSISEKIQIDLAVYYTFLDNAIARAPSMFNGEDSIDYDGRLSRVLALQNIGHVRVSGVQAAFTWKLTDKLSFRSIINYQKGKEKDPESGKDFSPPHVAPLFGATHLLFSDKKMKADLYAIYNGSVRYANLALSERADHHLYAMDAEGDPYAPSWATLNFKFSYNFLRKVSGNAGVENLLDKRYRPFSSGISAAGRNFIIALRVSI